MSKPTHITCRECGKKEKLRWMEDVRQELIERQLCFHCNFWIEKVNQFDNPDSVRVNGKHYWICKENVPKGSFRGFGGGKFIIRFFKPIRTVVSTNLWCQGKIPERFKDRLPDNAEFVQ